MTDESTREPKLAEGENADTGARAAGHLADADLLRQYVDGGSEAAIAELVRRHVDLVYFAALRQTAGDAALAQDVTQTVFTDLARKAPALTDRPALAGWLYTGTRFAAAKARRTERRRQNREQEAYAMQDSDPGANIEWELLRPVIDDALHALDECDREAVLLRFFEGRPFAEVGAALALSEDTARVRVNRALEKMRGVLVKQGVTSTPAALGLALAAQAGAAVPAGLTATITTAALAGAAAGSAGIAAAAWVFMNTVKWLGVAAGGAALALGAAFVAARGAREADGQVATATVRQTTLTARVGELEQRAQAAHGRLQQAEAENARLLQAVQKQTAGVSAQLAEEEPVTSDVVNERFQRAREMAKNGDPETALRELLWCFDVGMKRAAGLSAVRLSYAVSTIAELAELYPPARAALEERRAKARQLMLADEQDLDATRDFGAITRALKDGAAAIALLDQLPAGDRRRAGLASAAYDDLIDGQRYREALEGRGYGVMSSVFESATQRRMDRPGVPNAEDMERRNREAVIKLTVRNIEVLAGAGDVAHARTLAERLLAYDGSQATRALIHQHTTRAGHPELAPTAGR